MHTHTFELLLYHAEDKRLGINFKSIVNADAFFAEYYRLQSCLDSLSFDNTPFCNLTIDMSSVEYFDALSLSTFFVDLKNTAGLEEIKILLIDQMRMESPEEASLCRDFRRFFINFGFFDALQDIPGCKTEPKPDSELVREYAWHDNGCVVPFCFLTPGGLPIDDLRNAL